ncbi:MAG TPA: cytochrome c [Gemmatimonadales bacterium]|nr:cytochrome c [Gemmatimonadales bacterium]
MIRKTLLWLSGGILAVVIVFFIVISFRWNRRFDAPYPRITASTDTAVIARGRYLAYGPAHCSDCHTAPAEYASLRLGTQPPLSGGGRFDIPPGTIEVPNITADKETGIGMLSDSAVARVLRYGVRPDGRSAIPFMEYHEMSDADIAALISFLRAQPPVHNLVPDSKLNLLGKTVMAFVIKPIGPTARPPAESPAAAPTVERGEYLANAVANCAGCHSKRSMVTGAYTGPRLAGGSEMESSANSAIKLTPPNITADGRPGQWTEDEFVARFHAGERIAGSPMPWQAFRRIKDDDLRAIYRYLKTVHSS